jgi:putative transposase
MKPNEIWLTVKESSCYLGITERQVQKNVQSLKYGSVKYEVNSSQGGGTYILINLFNLPSSVQIAYFRDHGQTLPVNPEDDGWDQEPEWKRAIAAERIQTITAWEKYLGNQSGKKRSELTQEFLLTLSCMNPANKNISAQTLYRWRQDYRAGGRTDLLPGWGESKHEESIDPAAWAYFVQIYGTQRKRTAGDCYRELQMVAALRGWKIPNIRTIHRLIKRLPVAFWTELREGKEVFEQTCLPYMQRDRESINGNEWWIGDCHTLDFFAKGPNGNAVRLVLSAWVDFRSVKWMGWHIDYTGNTDTVMAGFARGAMSPDGIPYGVYMDNGREYDNLQFAYGGHRRKTKDLDKYNEGRIRSLVHQLCIETIFAIPKNARAKIIEREFREVARLFSKRFITYCGSKPNERPAELNGILKDKTNLPDLQTVRQLFDSWIVTERNQQPSQGNGRKKETPDQVFARTRLPIRRVSEAVMRLCFMPHSKPLEVENEGIKIFDTWYYDATLVTHLTEKVIVRYRNDDLSKVYIFTLDEQLICEAQMMGKYHAVKATKEDYEQHKSLKKRARQRIEEIKDNLADSGGVLAFNEYLNARAEQAAASATPVEKSNTVAMVPISPNLRNAAEQFEQMQRLSLAVGGEYQSSNDFHRRTEERFNRLGRALTKMENGGK